MLRSASGVLLAATTLVSGEVYFKETFDTDPFASGRWVVSSWKQDSGEAGKLEWSSGLWTPDESRKGIRTSEDARFYAVSAKMDKTLNNADKDLVLQFAVKHEQKIDCGGGYVKLLTKGAEVAAFNGETPYAIMFGPDICGYSTKKVQAILAHDGKNLAKKEDVKAPDDVFTHTYTFVVRPDETYSIRVDGEEKASGKLKEAWAFEEPETIADPEAKKPEDWVDNEYMDDPEDVKPADWDDEPEKIVDAEATKPEEWDDEEDGEWEAPMIRNPKYKGKWKAKRIKNPDFKGKWEAPRIPNPNYTQVSDVHKRGDLDFVAMEIWQVKAGSLFSDFIVTDSLEEAEAFAAQRKVAKDDEEAAKKAYDKANAPPEEPEEDFEDEEEDKTEL